MKRHQQGFGQLSDFGKALGIFAAIVVVLLLAVVLVSGFTECIEKNGWFMCVK